MLPEKKEVRSITMTSSAPAFPPVEIPLIGNTISCGFPSPADEYLERNLDLNEHLISKPAATFFIRAKGDSMIGAGIHENDLLIIDRAITAQNNHVVVAVLNGEFTLKRLRKLDGKIFLFPENPKYSPIEIKEGMEFEIWGVAIHCIHKLV